MSQDQQAFLDYGDGSFRAAQWWVFEDRVSPTTTHQAMTIFLWDDVAAVQQWGHPTPQPLAPEGSKCMIHWRGTWITLLATYNEVAVAWQRHRNRTSFRSILGAN